MKNIKQFYLSKNNVKITISFEFISIFDLIRNYTTSILPLLTAQ